MAASQAERLLAQGAPLTLTDGREVRVRFDMRALVLAEKEFGSIEGMAQALNADDVKFTTYVRVLECALSRDVSHDELLDVLPTDMVALDRVIADAFEEAFPSAKASDPNLPGEENSPGLNGSTPPQSPLAAAMISGGE